MEYAHRIYSIEMTDFGPSIVIENSAPYRDMSFEQMSEYKRKVSELIWNTSKVREMTDVGTKTLEHIIDLEIGFKEAQRKVEDATKALSEAKDSLSRQNATGNLNLAKHELRARMSDFMSVALAYIIVNNYKGIMSEKPSISYEEALKNPVTENAARQLGKDYSIIASFSRIRSYFDELVKEISTDFELNGIAVVDFLNQAYSAHCKSDESGSRKSSAKKVKDEIVKAIKRQEEIGTGSYNRSLTIKISAEEFRRFEEAKSAANGLPLEGIKTNEESVVKLKPEKEEMPTDIITEAGAKEGGASLESRTEQQTHKDGAMPKEISEESPKEKIKLVEEPEKNYTMKKLSKRKDKEKKKKLGFARKAAGIIALLGILGFGGVYIVHTYFPKACEYLEPLSPFIRKIDELVQRIID